MVSFKHSYLGKKGIVYSYCTHFSFPAFRGMKKSKTLTAIFTLISSVVVAFPLMYINSRKSNHCLGNIKNIVNYNLKLDFRY